ncbi:MAG: glycosyltransferase, partial [Candidatus Omnitrophica bacterium]|nr:glycosyltransferase [Candidatus Omnitrophota bacterium]
MKIAINCRSFLKPNFTGIGRYAHNLVHHLSQISQTHQYFLYAPIGLFDRKRKPPYIGKNNFFTKVDRFGRGPSKVLKNFDIYHSPSPDMIEEMDSKIIVTVHDLVYKAFPQGHTEETLRLTDEQFKNFLPRVSRLLCTSKNTAKDLKKYFQVDDSKIRIIYSGVDKKAFYPVTAEEVPAMQKTIINKGINEEFILYVGTIEPRKNLDNLLKAFVQLKQEQRFDGKLVIAGMKGWKSQSFEDNLKK